VTARLWGHAKGTSGSVSITVNRHEAERSLSSLRGLRSWIALRRRSRCRRFSCDYRVSDEVSLQALQTMHVSWTWWATCIFQPASSESKHSGLGTAETSGPGQAPPALDFGVRCGPPTDMSFVGSLAALRLGPSRNFAFKARVPL
jgi:hypothetical protein